MKHHCPKATMLVVGTKIDLRDDAETIEKLRLRGQMPLSIEDGQQLAKEIGAIGYAECSALTQKGIKQLFDEAILAVINPPADTKKSKKNLRKCDLL